ncbi:hypothetical protein ACFLV2_00595 [Chloroflexota bacterium]
MTIKSLSKPINSESLGFYTPAEASRIAQVPIWTVNSWRRNGIVVPSVEWIDETNKTHIGHTFETVVFLRLIRLLRDKGKISLLQSVKAVKELRTRLGTPGRRWADAKIFVLNKEVIVADESDGYGSTIVTRGHQTIAEFFFGEEFKRLKERADALLIPEKYMNYIEIDPSIQNGLPIVSNSSVLSILIHKLYVQGYEYRDIHDMYPFIPLNKIKGVEEYESFLDKIGKN